MTPQSKLTFRRIGMALLLGLLSGCAQIYDPVDEAILRVRCCVQSKTSWYQHRPLYQEVTYVYHFGKGYRAGYESVCQGGGGCPPTLPPREYWSACYQNDVGRAQSVEWFNGFAEGALVAQMDGCDGASEIVTSREATGQSCRLETEYHYDPDQSTPYPGDGYGPDDYAPPHDHWQDDAATRGLPPAPEMAPDVYPSPFMEPGSRSHGERTWDTPTDEGQQPGPPLPLPPLDEGELPETGTEPPIPNIDFHVDTRPDGRPLDLTPTGFLSPEEESGEQLGSRINALLRKVF